MILKISKDNLSNTPITGYVVGGQTDEVRYEVSDDFIRDLKIFLHGREQTNYTTMLIKLIFKADNINLEKLTKIYPAECLTVWCYRNIRDFYKQLDK